MCGVSEMAWGLEELEIGAMRSGPQRVSPLLVTGGGTCESISISLGVSWFGNRTSSADPSSSAYNRKYLY